MTQVIGGNQMHLVVDDVQLRQITISEKEIQADFVLKSGTSDLTTFSISNYWHKGSIKHLEYTDEMLQLFQQLRKIITARCRVSLTSLDKGLGTGD